MVYKTDFTLNAGFKADLTLKMEIDNRVWSLPVFIGNKCASGMEIGIFEVVFKTLVSEAHFLKWRVKKWKEMCWEVDFEKK